MHVKSFLRHNYAVVILNKKNLNKSIVNTLSLSGWKNLLCYAFWVRLQCGSMCGRI